MTPIAPASAHGAAAPRSTPSALVWRSPLVRLAIAIVPGWIVFTDLFFNIGWPTKAIVASELALSMVSPVAGLVAVAAVTPFGYLIAVTVSGGTFRVSEAIVLAFFVGWLLRGWKDRDGPRTPAAIGWLFAAAVVASIVGLTWRLGRYPGELAKEFDLLVHLYNVADDRIGFVAGARLLEGVALTAATVTVFRQRPRLATILPAVLAGAGVVAAAAAILLWYGYAPREILRLHALNTDRFSGHVRDVNAAGSYFAMLVCVAAGMFLRARTVRGRAIWAIVVAANAGGLWLSGSGGALVATVGAAILIALWVASSRPFAERARFALLMLATVAALIGAVGIWRAAGRHLTSSASFRAQFNATSGRMIAARPLAGVGVGQYHRSSTLFLGPELAWYYGEENAHDYFLQSAAELGIPGLALFAGFLGAALWRAAQALSKERHDVRMLGVGTGVGVFVATAAAGQPFLVDEVALPFWVLLGLCMSLAGSVVYRTGLTDPAVGAGSWRTWATAAGIVYVAALAPIGAARGDVDPPRSSAVDGFYGWETGSDGVRYRWTGEYASIFVPGGVQRVEIPLRLPIPVRALKPVLVTSSVDGHPRNGVMAGDAWTVIGVDLPNVLPPTTYERINLKVERTWQPAMYIAGSADMRALGVQVGEWRLLRSN